MQLSDRTKGILFLLLSSAGFALVSLFVRLAGDVPTTEKTLHRNAISTAAIVMLLARSKTSPAVPEGARRDMFFRCLFGCTGMICYLWSIDHMGLADANMLNKTSPFFTILMSFFILGEKPSLKDMICILIMVVGAVLVVKPGQGLASFPALVALFGGFIAGTAYSFVRKVGLKGIPAPVTVFYYSLFASLVSLPFVIREGFQARGMQVVCLLIVGILASLVQLSLTKAYRLAPAKEISVYEYSQILFAALLGFLVWNEFPDMMSLIGYIIIIGCAVYRARN